MIIYNYNYELKVKTYFDNLDFDFALFNNYNMKELYDIFIKDEINLFNNEKYDTNIRAMAIYLKNKHINVAVKLLQDNIKAYSINILLYIYLKEKLYEDFNYIINKYIKNDAEYWLQINLGNYNYLLGLYYLDVKPQKSVEYFQIAANKGYQRAIYYLGYYYDKIDFNKALLLKNYNMVIENKYSFEGPHKYIINAYINLGNFYRFIENDYDKMEFYYNLAINYKIDEYKFNENIVALDLLRDYINSKLI